MECRYVILILLLFILKGILNEKKNFGPYKLEYTRCEICKGPKKTDCADIKIMNKNDMSRIQFVGYFANDCAITKGRVAVGTVTDKNITKPLFNHPIPDPCHHFVAWPTFQPIFNLTENCIIKKGQYSPYVNMSRVTRTYLGPSFFYGVYIWKIIMYNERNNVLCLYLASRVYK